MKTMNLLTRNILLLAIDAFGGNIEGKTLLQKRMYFLGQLLREKYKARPGFGFDAHFYGPYSTVVSDDLTTLINQGFVREECVSFGTIDSHGFEMRRYRYELTAEGHSGVEWLKTQYPDEARQVYEAAQSVLKAGELNYVDLSIAAKAHFILGKANRPMTPKNVTDEAKRFSWVVEERKIQTGFEFLTKLGLAAKV